MVKRVVQPIILSCAVNPSLISILLALQQNQDAGLWGVLHEPAQCALAPMEAPQLPVPTSATAIQSSTPAVSSRNSGSDQKAGWVAVALARSQT